MDRKTRNRMNGWIRAAKIGAFFLTLLIIAFIGILWFARPKTSDVEKRTLTQFPKLTLATFWNGEFFSGVDTWYADTFPTRESLISGSKWLESHYGSRGEQVIGEAKTADEIPTGDETDEPGPAPVTPDDIVPQPEPEPEIKLPDTEGLENGTVYALGEFQGNIYITDNCGYELYYFTKASADRAAEGLNEIYDAIGDKVEMYVMIDPNSAGVMLDQSVLDSMGCSNERDAIHYVYGKLKDGIHKVNAVDNLIPHNAEYIYFHTDHHWTALGAYYAYQAFCVEKGVMYHDFKTYESMEFPGFLGTFYSYSNQSQALKSNPDTVVAYVPKGTNLMEMTQKDGNAYDWNIIQDASDYSEGNKYLTFVGGDQPYSWAHNETITDGSAVLVIKDSYGNAFIPWLIDHYEYVYWVDFRYTSNTVSQMVADHGIQDVIFSLSIYNGTTDSVTSYLKKVGQ